ncbi:MAG: hypothetical protein KDN19_10455 [Verrucomicrobiae bacterium]|nr:hypothetical protein [Verrucomicrobiae bacterium]
MKLMVVWWSVFSVYAAVNLAAVFLPFIPGLGTLYLFGLVLPLGIIIGWWTYLARRKPRARQWWVLGLISTFAYAGLGFGSFWIISAMWASV